MAPIGLMGTLYLGLMRLEQRGLVRAVGCLRDSNRKARFYGLPRPGVAVPLTGRNGSAPHPSSTRSFGKRSNWRMAMATLHEWIIRLWQTVRGRYARIWNKNCGRSSLPSRLMPRAPGGDSSGSCRKPRIEAGGV